MLTYWELDHVVRDHTTVDGFSDTNPGVCVIDLKRLGIHGFVYINNSGYYQDAIYNPILKVEIDPMNDSVYLIYDVEGKIRTKVPTEFLGDQVIIKKDNRDLKIIT